MVSFKGMGRFSLVVGFLTVLLALAGCSGPPLIPGEKIPGVQHRQPMKTWPATPEPSETSFTPEPPVSYHPEPTETTDIPSEGNLASFDHFNVRVVGTTGRPDSFDVQAEVCVTEAVNSKGTRISAGPWTVTTHDGGVYKPDASPEYDPANFPEPKLYDVGECAFGWLHFNANGMNIREIGYANSLGNQALWNANGTRK